MFDWLPDKIKGHPVGWIIGTVIATAGLTWVVLDSVAVVRFGMIEHREKNIDIFTERVFEKVQKLGELQLQMDQQSLNQAQIGERIKSFDNSLTDLESRLKETITSVDSIKKSEIAKAQRIIRELAKTNVGDAFTRISAIENSLKSSLFGNLSKKSTGKYSPSSQDLLVFVQIQGRNSKGLGNSNWGYVQGLVNGKVLGSASMDYSRTGAEDNSFVMAVPRGNGWEVRVPSSRPALAKGVSVYVMRIGYLQ